ncbi:DoxX family protein [Nocardia huaxiensis]|uniref:DoxX family protein n=1 Tax=Nocardia huaxiensis TaxID=2755382 RepID=UPI001E4549AE|nr:DoxX family protein [Nocardia huaxiensis]UFS96393.1 DoxX family protein [Nocardia huaxiensis]
MTQKPNEPSADATGSDVPASPESATALSAAMTGGSSSLPDSVGEPVRSPFDSPTEQFRVADVHPDLIVEAKSGRTADTKPELTKEPPRTDEELGLDPDVPLYSELKNSIPGAAQQSAALAAESASAATYAFASIPAAPPGATEPTTRLRRRGDDRRGTLDLGLLLLRLVIGGTFIYHGLQKMTGWFHGPGLDGTKAMMENGGWKQPDITAILLAVGELGGGILVVLGLATPLAAGALLAIILDAWMWKQSMVPGFQYKAKDNNLELESVLVGIVAVLMLTGPGRLSLDRNRGWATRPFLGSLAAFVAAIAAAILAYIYLHGGNPLTGIGPFD